MNKGNVKALRWHRAQNQTARPRVGSLACMDARVCESAGGNESEEIVLSSHTPDTGHK